MCKQIKHLPKKQMGKVTMTEMIFNLIYVKKKSTNKAVILNLVNKN